MASPVSPSVRPPSPPPPSYPPRAQAPPPSGKLSAHHVDGASPSHASVQQPLEVALVPYRGRALTSTTVSTFAELQAALSGSEAIIRLAAGTYQVTSTITISRDVTLTADVEGSSVVLDGGNARSVMRINSGTVQLTGLTITNGFVSVRHASPLRVFGAHALVSKSELLDALAFRTDLLSCLLPPSFAAELTGSSVSRHMTISFVWRSVCACACLPNIHLCPDEVP